MLASGKLKDAGSAQSNGRTVRRLKSSDRYRVLTYDVDPTTFAPVGGSITIKFRHDSNTDATTFVVETYERIPIDAADERVFTIKTKPDPQVNTKTKQQWLDHIARTKAWLRCEKRHHRNTKTCGKDPYGGAA